MSDILGGTSHADTQYLARRYEQREYSLCPTPVDTVNRRLPPLRASRLERGAQTA